MGFGSWVSSPPLKESPTVPTCLRLIPVAVNVALVEVKERNRRSMFITQIEAAGRLDDAPTPTDRARKSELRDRLVPEADTLRDQRLPENSCCGNGIETRG